MQINPLQLTEQARAILQNNRRGSFTVPTDRLYPFQWNWDSGFVSLGLANYNVQAAMAEVMSLLSGQWANGMIPHITFHSENETSYFPNWDFWDAAVNPGAPSSPKTSGITQPPVLGFVLESILDKHPDNPEVRRFARSVFPKILKYHSFWYNYRDPNEEGLVFIFHPWESGRDNSPLWDDALNLIDLGKADLPDYQRKDTQHADAAERPTNKNYDQFVYLLELGKKYRYDGKEIAESSEFLIQDSLVNALLIRSNEGLIKVGKTLGLDTGQLEEWQQQSLAQYDQKLWSESLGSYTGYDMRQNKQLPYWEIGGLTAMFGNVPSTGRALHMLEYLEKLIENNFMLVPSFDVWHDYFDSKRYWRGPIWPQMNWLVYHGMKNYGFEEMADTVRNNFLELVQRFGFHEYFEAQKDLIESSHGGYGGNNFSWTASSVIDLIEAP